MGVAAIREAVEAGRQPFPLLKLSLATRGLELGTELCSPAIRATAAGQVTRTTKPGGWDEIVYGSGVQGGGLRVVETGVAVADATGDLMRLLQAYDPRGSAALIYQGAPGLAEADFDVWFTGILADWADDAPYTKLLLKTDDTVLRTPVPLDVLKRTEWGRASDATIFGTHPQLLFGVHDSQLITLRGMVNAINLRYDTDAGVYWWGLSVGHMVSASRIYFDGDIQDGDEGTWWRLRQEVRGQSLWTIVEIDEGYQPEEGTLVSLDCEGPDENGLAVGPAMTNPVRQLRTIIEEYGYRTPPLVVYRGAHPVIDATSWDAAEALYETRLEADSAIRFGGDQDEQSVAEVIQSFLDAYPWARIDWTEHGTLAFSAMDPDDVDPDDDLHLDLDAHMEGQRVPYQPGDRKEVYTHIIQPFLYSNQEAKYLNAYEAHDVAALPEKVAKTIENPWSPARYKRE